MFRGLRSHTNTMVFHGYRVAHKAVREYSVINTPGPKCLKKPSEKNPTINTRVRQLLLRKKTLRSQFNYLRLGKVQVHLDAQNTLQAHFDAAQLVTV